MIYLHMYFLDIELKEEKWIFLKYSKSILYDKAKVINVRFNNIFFSHYTLQ